MLEPFDPEREAGLDGAPSPTADGGVTSEWEKLFKILEQTGAVFVPSDSAEPADPSDLESSTETVEPAEADRDVFPDWLEIVDEGSREVILGFVTTGLEMHERYGGQMPQSVDRPCLLQRNATDPAQIANFKAMLEGLALETEDADGKKDIAAALESSREDWVVDGGARFIMYPWLQRAFEMEFYDQDGSLLSNTAIPMSKKSGITLASAVIGTNAAHQETLLVVVEVPTIITSRDASGAETEVTMIKRLAYFDTRQL
jgi:hypothetical protein